MQILLFIVFIFALWIPGFSKNEPVTYKFEYLTTNEGLTSNRIYAVCRDSKGFLWIGYEAGLDRFDGYTLKKYRNIPCSQKSLSSNLIRCIFEDSKENLWIGTTDGLNLYNKDIDSFTIFRHAPGNSKSLNGNTITNIFEDSKKNLWIVTGFSCLNKWNPVTHDFKKFEIPNNANKNQVEYSRNIAEDSDGNFWIVSFSSELYRFNPNSESFTTFSDPKINFGNDIKGVFLDSEEEIWIFTYGSGLYSFNKKSNQFTKYKVSNDGTGTNFSSIRDIIQEDREHLLIGVDQGGLNRYNKKTKHFEYFLFNEAIPDGINNNGIWGFYKDKEGIFYINNSGGGLNICNPKKGKFKRFKHHSSDSFSISYSFTDCFYEDTFGQIWIGTDGGGVNKFNPTTGKFTVFKNNFSNNPGITGNVIRAFAPDKNGDLWIASWDAGLECFSPRTGKFVLYKLKEANNDSISEHIWHIKIDNNNLLWIGLIDGGVLHFDKQKGIIRHFKNEPNNENSLPNNRIWYFYHDMLNNMWICTWDGLCRYNSTDKSFIRIKRLPDNDIRALHIDNNKTLWVGTATKGIYKLNYKGEILACLSEKEGLLNNKINAIVEDNHENLWISTHQGISKYNKKNGTFRNYKESDGLEGNEFFSQSFLKTKNGHIYFGGLNGFNTFHPDSLKDNLTIPNVVITDFYIFNNPTLVKTKDHTLKHISNCGSFVLEPEQKIFSFLFTATNLTYPERNQYAYMLEGFDKDWIYTDHTRRYITYTNLNPGTYNFKVKASNNDGIWNEKGTSVQLTILPPWYRTLWFRLIALAFVIVLLLLFYYMRLSFYRNQRRMLTAMVKEKTLSLEELAVSLEEKQEEVNMQKEELMAQKEELVAQKESLKSANTILIEQKQRIYEQNIELDKHRNELENLVEQRTSELVASKLRAEESDRLKSAFLANMSHEIRTPMNAIVGFSSLLRDEELTTDEKKNMIDIIIKNSESLQILINDILFLSKIQANQLTFNISTINIQGLLEEIHKTFTIAAQKKNISLILKKDLLTPGLTIKSDSTRLKQVLSNLINNAIKYTDKGGIQFGISTVQENCIVFYIRDSGIGIAPEIGMKIFERFTKIEDKHHLYGGTGLGLAICQSIVKMWNGDIWYESELNNGTTFFFSHPTNINLNVKQPTSSLLEQINIPNYSSKTILIAEDNENNYLLLQSYLNKTKAKLVWVHNGFDAIQFVAQNNVDLILMDIKMNVINGVEATRQIKLMKPDIPVIAQTAYAFENEISSFSQCGLDMYLTKPVKINELYSALDKYLNA